MTQHDRGQPADSGNNAALGPQQAEDQEAALHQEQGGQCALVQQNHPRDAARRTVLQPLQLKLHATGIFII